MNSDARHNALIPMGNMVTGQLIENQLPKSNFPGRAGARTQGGAAPRGSSLPPSPTPCNQFKAFEGSI